ADGDMNFTKGHISIYSILLSKKALKRKRTGTAAADRKRACRFARATMGKRVLVTGTDGYIGAVLAPTLLERGYDVVGVDCGFYRDGWLFDDWRPRPFTLTKDIRVMGPKDFEGFDAIVHLAELSNDPLGEHDPATTYEINHRGSVKIAAACKAAGVPRFIYASS